MTIKIKTFLPGTEVALLDLLELDLGSLNGLTSILVKDRFITPKTTNQSGSYHVDLGGYLKNKDGKQLPIDELQTILISEIGNWSFVIDSKKNDTLFSNEIGFNLVFDSGVTTKSDVVFAIPSTKSILIADVFRDPMGDGSLTPADDGEGYYVAQNFDVKNSAIGSGSQHLGIDWNGELKGNTDLGYPVFSVANGIVIHTDTNKAFGKHVVVSHLLQNGDIVHSLYAHLDKISVSVGDVLTWSSKIGHIS